MKISVIDGSNYFKGLLLLIRMDKEVRHPEIALMKTIGKTLGFEKEFCDDAIRDILENKFISDEHPRFSSKEIALRFIRDGLSLAFSDDELHPSEKQWLKRIADRNGIEPIAFQQELENAVSRKKPPDRLEIDDLSIQF